MNSTVKTILIWVLILVVGVGLYNLIERPETAQSLNFTDLLTRVERGQVAEVNIAGSQLRGQLVQGNEPFRSTIPEGYVAIYDKLTAAKVKVNIVPQDPPVWPTAIMSWLMPMLLAFSLGWFCATRMGRRPTAA